MNSEDDMLYDDESEHDVEEDDADDFVEMGVETEPATRDKYDVNIFPFEVLTAEKIVQHMVDCIKEVNTVVQVRYIYFVYFQFMKDYTSGSANYSAFNGCHGHGQHEWVWDEWLSVSLTLTVWRVCVQVRRRFFNRVQNNTELNWNRLFQRQLQ